MLCVRWDDEEMKKKKPYKYNSKSRLTPNSQSFPFKVNTIKKDVKTNLENTLTKLRIIEDEPEKKEVLDNSFLEGRVEQKVENKKKEKERKKKEKEERRKAKQEKVRERFSFDEKTLEKISFLKKTFLTISFVCLVLVAFLYSLHFVYEKVSTIYQTNKTQIKITDKLNSNLVDINYLFVGDFHTSGFSFDEYDLDYHYVNQGSGTLTTSEILDQMKMRIYDYNPSVIFLEIGLVDLSQGDSLEEIRKNYGRIIDLIHSNRPNAVIVVEALYPVNPEIDSFSDTIMNHVTNRDIQMMNDSLRSLAIEKDVQYFDTYTLFSKNQVLNPQFTEDGVHLNKEGYQLLYKEIMNLVG